MTGPSFAVVCTTIGDGSFLKAYAKALEGADATMYVIPDRKTPKDLHDAVRAASAAGLSVECPDLGYQVSYLHSLNAPAGMFPWDTDHRRNVGYLMAYESGADIVISVDDDNLPQDDWLAEHAEALSAEPQLTFVGRETVFWNPLSRADVMRGPAYPRGYPYSWRVAPGRLDEPPEWTSGRAKIAINTGLWLGDPDVDAITRIATRPVSWAVDPGGMPLAGPIWAPVNSQNTAVRREVIPAYYFFRSPRFGDIYQGYLAQACAKHLGHSVRFGTPVVRHERNEHDLLRDLEAELPDILVLDRWLDWLTAAKPEGSTYAAAYASLADQLVDLADSDVWTFSEQHRFDVMVGQMRAWLQLCKRIDG